MPFRDVTGHRRVIELLSRSIQRESLPPSLLFTGPHGAGKRQTAIAVAQALNCLHPTGSAEHPARATEHPAHAAEHPTRSAEHPARAAQHPAQATEHPTRSAEHPAQATVHLSRASRHDAREFFDACGRCNACVRIARAVHADVLLVEPGDTGSIKMEQVREIVERSAYRPFEGRRRVVIVNEADALVPQAQNALLKTLEEPPPASVFILLTSHPDMLLPTVRSRLIRLSFTQAGGAEVDIGARATAERVLAHAAATADPGRRLEAAKELLSRSGGTASNDREQLAVHLREMASLVRDAAATATGVPPGLLSQAQSKPADRIVQAFRGDRGLRAFAAVDRALAALDRNAGVKVVADWVVLQL